MGVTLLGAAGEVKEQYEISNSLLFFDSDSPGLTRTPSSEGNRKTFTISCWFKRTTPGARQFIINSWGGSTNDYAQIEITSSDGITVQNIVSNSQQLDLRTNRLFRDPAAWYHIVLAVDSTQSTSSDRAKLYVNGVQETSFSTETYMSQNNDTYFNDDIAHYIGKRGDNSNYFDGYMTEFHMVDGSQLLPTSFGEFNDNAVWIPKRYTGSHGTNGFFLQFKQTGTSQNSSGIGADTSGNDNHFAVSNLAATDVTEDTCTNNFATCNVLSGKNTSDLTNGNLHLDADSTGDIIAPSTIGFSSGKWYMEMKSTITAGHGNRKTVGVYETDSDINHPRQFTSSSPYNGVVVDLRNGSAYESADDDDATDISSFANNDICGLAYDADNGLLYVYKNGTAENSGNAINAGNALDTSKTYAFYIAQDGGGTNNGELFCNFGNPSFAISSGNTDGKYGNFEYAPPSGYYALCTKRLAEFG
jgi:hypothetical protein